MTVLQEYKCPCCDGAVEFNSRSQKMKCLFCSTEFEMETMEAYAAELSKQPQDNMSWDATAGTQWYAGETNGLLNYQCNSCGGEIVADMTTGATECPFC